MATNTSFLYNIYYFNLNVLLIVWKQRQFLNLTGELENRRILSTSATSSSWIERLIVYNIWLIGYIQNVVVHDNMIRYMVCPKCHDILCVANRSVCFSKQSKLIQRWTSRSAHSRLKQSVLTLTVFFNLTIQQLVWRNKSIFENARLTFKPFKFFKNSNLGLSCENLLGFDRFNNYKFPVVILMPWSTKVQFSIWNDFSIPKRNQTQFILAVTTWECTQSLGSISFDLTSCASPWWPPHELVAWMHLVNSG